MPITRQHFQPAWWLKNPHLQTLYPALLRKSPPLQRQRQRLITPDDDFIDLDWYGDTRNPLVILLHGLSGSSASGYILGLQQALSINGISSVAMNFRGCSGEPNRKARSYHSGETEDIHFVYQYIRQCHPDSALAAVGFSLGGNVLLKWLGEQGENVSLQAAVAVSVPLVLSECASRLDTGFSRVYRKHLLDELKLYIHNKHRCLTHHRLFAEADKLNQLGDLSDIHSFWQYDDRVVAKLHGYQNASDYYHHASSRQFLSTIKNPTLVIHAEDDPFMTPDVVPNAGELSPQVLVEIYTTGGHVGFIGSKDALTPSYWLDSRIPAFLKPHLQPD
ncbi:MAG: hydrolase [Methylomonas sp.]|nr:MAG: hydrolase [Methylomonas sp.]